MNFRIGETIRKLHMPGETLKKAELIKPGDTVDVFVEFSTNKVHFWLNEKYQGRPSKYLLPTLIDIS